MEEPAATFDAANAREESPEEVGERAKKLPKAGDAAAALASAEVAIDAQYATPAQHHNAIELFTTTASWSGDELTIYEPSQFVFGLKNNLAEKLGIDAEQIRVVSPYVGGAFGSKAQMTPRTALIALAANGGSAVRSSSSRPATRPSRSRPTGPRPATASAWARGATAGSPRSSTKAGR